MNDTMVALSAQNTMALPVVSGPPRGAPPKDPTKLALYLERKAQWQKQAGVSSNLNMSVSPVHHIPETPDQIISRVSERFEIMYKMTKGCAQGVLRSLIITGAGGIGKTFGVTEVVERERADREATIEMMPESGIPELIVDVIGGYMTPMSLYMALYRNRFENSLLIFDDCDSVLEDGKSINLLKHATDTTPIRRISYASDAQTLKDNNVPQSFVFQGTIIVISNLNFHGIVNQGRHKLVPHLKALMTRTDVLDLKLHTNRETVIWINHVVSSTNMLVNEGLSGEQQTMVMQYLDKNQDELQSLSFRNVRRIAGYMKMDWNSWQQMANVLMLR
jgi:hypothetical protein